MAIIEFAVNEKKKRSLEQRLRRTSGSIVLRVLKRAFSLLCVVAPATFCLYAYLISDGFVYRHDRYGTLGQKNTLFILVVAGAIFAVCLMLALVFHVLENGFANQDTHYRVSESLFLEGDILRYCYKNYMHSMPWDMVVVKIKLDGNTRIHYTAVSGEILFSGLISSVYYENYELHITRGKETFVQQDFSIYDYFSPSLWQYLERFS